MLIFVLSGCSYYFFKKYCPTKQTKISKRNFYNFKWTPSNSSDLYQAPNKMSTSGGYSLYFVKLVFHKLDSLTKKEFTRKTCYIRMTLPSLCILWDVPKLHHHHRRISLCFQLDSQAALLLNRLQNSCSPVRKRGKLSDTIPTQTESNCYLLPPQAVPLQRFDKFLLRLPLNSSTNS